MNKTRMFYPVLWAFFIGGVIIGTLCANFISHQFIQSLGVCQLYTNTSIETFTIFDKNWIFYIIINRLKFWILYLLLSFTAAQWIVTLVESATFGCIGAILLVSMTRLYGIFSIVLFGATLFPHYIAYVIAFLFVTESIRITTIAPQKIVLQKMITGSLCWCIGIFCEIFINPTLIYWTLKLF